MITDIIAACGWYSDPYIFFSGNVFSNLIYYSHLTPIIVSLALGIYVYVSNRQSLINKTLLVITLVLSTWLLLDLILWATDSIRIVMFAWPIINMIEPAIYAGFVYFIYLFITGKDIGWKTKLLLVLPLIPTILSTGTGWNVFGFNLTDCDREAIEGPITFYNYFIEIAYSVWILGLGIWTWFRSASTNTQKKQSLLVVVSSLVLLLGFALGNITGSFTEDWTIGQYGLFVLPVSIGTLTYFVVQFRFFAKSELAGAQLLIIGLWLAVGSIFFIQSLDYVHWIVGGTLALLTIIGYLLIRSIRTEIKQRTEIEKLASELKGSNEQLEKVNVRLKELDKAKDEFLSIATHQLKAPLSSIRGAAANILDGSFGKLSAKIQEPVQSVFEVATGMVRLIDDYLNISRIEQGRMKYELSDFDITLITKKVADDLRVTAVKKNIELIFNGPEPLVITADIGKMTQVVTNLVDNAIKYTPKGHVTATAEKFEKEEKEFARVVVSDSGIGIDPSEIGKLFQRFSRAADANKTNTQGTGLGLYVAKQLTEGCGGIIRIESDGLGKGSRFIIEFPIAKPAATATPKT